MFTKANDKQQGISILYYILHKNANLPINLNLTSSNKAKANVKIYKRNLYQ